MSQPSPQIAFPRKTRAAIVWFWACYWFWFPLQRRARVALSCELM